MGREHALKNIRLEPCDRWGHTEYSLKYHKDYLERKTGISRDAPDFMQHAYDMFEMDFLWGTSDGLLRWEKHGRVTDMGHASYAAGGTDMRAPAASPFETLEQVWEFDAVEEYGLPDFDEQVDHYQSVLDARREANPDRVCPGGYYKTMVSGAIQAFGWDMLLMGCSDPVKMEKVFDSFFRRTLFHMKAWSRTTADVLIQHDDFVWTSGPFMSPDIYRKIIIPRYAQLWKPAHEAGKKVLFCSDGLFTEFAADIVEAGADGLVFEPCNDFGFMADNFGGDVCLVGSFVDCRDLTFSRWEKVQADIDRTFEKMEQCRGAIAAVGNHLPRNIPEPMMDRYFGRLLPKLEKKPR